MFPIPFWLTRRRLVAKSPQTRLGAVQKLRRRGRRAALLVLARVLEDPDAQVRAEAGKAMMEGLQAAPERVQAEVVEALKTESHPWARNALVIALQAGTDSVRWQAVQALRARGWTARDSSEQLAFHIAVGDLEKAAAVGPAAIAQLDRILREGSYQHKVTAANLLGQFEEEEAMAPLIAALKDPDVIVRTAAERRAAYDLVRGEVEAGRQAFVVCAAIDEANKTEVRAAEAEADRLATEVFPDLRITLLHGRMRPREKDQRMEAFRAGESDLLIATTVIEVGVDVPNATVMLVENAERFGLAQLHQLRGRIGRGSHGSFCVLFDESAPDNEEARGRLQAMARTTDGFELADEDLRLQERVRVGEDKCLSQLRLSARGSRNTRRGAHQRRDFAIQCAVARRSGQPVDCVLQHTRDPMVVLGRGDQQPVRLPNGVAKLHDARRDANSLDIAVVQRDLVQLVNRNV